MNSNTELIHTLRAEQRNHAERAGVNRCHCEFCAQACAEIMRLTDVSKDAD